MREISQEIILAGLGRTDFFNHALLSSALDQQGPWAGSALTTDNTWCINALSAVIETVNWPLAREDVRRFLKPIELPSLELWSTEFFLAQINKI